MARPNHIQIVLINNNTPNITIHDCFIKHTSKELSMAKAKHNMSVEANAEDDAQITLRGK